MITFILNSDITQYDHFTEFLIKIKVSLLHSTNTFLKKIVKSYQSQRKSLCMLKVFVSLVNIWLLFVSQCKYWKKAQDMQCESERYHLYKYWARFFCFYKEQPLNLIKWGHGTHNACKNQIWSRCRLQDYLFEEKDFHFSSAAYQTILCYISCLYFVIGSTMVRRLVSTLPGWAFTQKCCFLLRSWEWSVLFMVCLVTKTISQG